MSVNKARIKLLQATALGSSIATDPSATRIIDEFEQVLEAARVKKPARRCLLQVTHSSRALDSSLKAFLTQEGVVSGAAASKLSLGRCFVKLTNHKVPMLARLPMKSQRRFQRNIVVHRNTYMHQAGSYPNDVLVRSLLADMQSCLTAVTAL